MVDYYIHMYIGNLRLSVLWKGGRKYVHDLKETKREKKFIKELPV